MRIEIKPGKYIVAVSGGVDSVVLLHILAHSSQLAAHSSLIVAHFDHGIRPDSQIDKEFVAELAEKYGLTFEYKREHLGPKASEALARAHRYRFLREVQEKNNARAVITAHHQDDMIETACINVLRGTGRKGLTSLSSGNNLIRPLLKFPKSELIYYAKARKLTWREDSTNTEEKYLRNRIRQKLAQNPQIKTKLLDVINQNSVRNLEIDYMLEDLFSSNFSQVNHSFSRYIFTGLPYNVSCEFLAHWLRKSHIEFSKKQLELLVVNLKTGRVGARFDVDKHKYFMLEQNHISLQTD